MSCNGLGDGHDRALPRRTRTPSIVLAPRTAPSWITTTWTSMPWLEQVLGLHLDPRRFVVEQQALGGPGPHELGRGPDRGADDADLHPVDRQHRRRR